MNPIVRAWSRDLLRAAVVFALASLPVTRIYAQDVPIPSSRVCAQVSTPSVFGQPPGVRTICTNNVVTNNAYGFPESIDTPLITAYSTAHTAQLLEQNNALLKAQTEMMQKLIDSNTATTQAIAKQVSTFDRDLQATILARFDALHSEVAEWPAFKQLRADILKAVDDKIKAAGPAVSPPPASPQTSASGLSARSPARETSLTTGLRAR